MRTSKTEYIMVRVSEEEKREIERQAAEQHMTVSQYLRWLALAKGAKGRMP